MKPFIALSIVLIFSTLAMTAAIVSEANRIIDHVDNLADAVHYTTNGCVSLNQDDGQD